MSMRVRKIASGRATVEEYEYSAISLDFSHVRPPRIRVIAPLVSVDSTNRSPIYRSAEERRGEKSGE